MNSSFRILQISLIALQLSGFLACSARVSHERPMQTGQQAAINVNLAVVNELETLPGIGRKTAEAIVAYRSEHGPFRRVEHLMLIRGISEKRFFEIRPLIRID